MNEKNRALHKGLIKILDDAEHKLLVREIPTFTAVYNWVKEMPLNLVEKENIKPVQEAVKKKVTKKVAKK